ncbi:MAG TPA: hypothetical protein VF868_00375 [Bacteroidia bacterium]
MKTNAKTLAIFMLAVAGFVTSCKKEDLNPMNGPRPKPTQTSLSKVNPPQETSTWKVTKLYVTGEMESDETEKFRDWAFAFHADGTVIASGKSGKVKGRWSSKYSDGTGRMFIDFGGQEPFMELNETWLIVKQTDDYKVLEDDLGDDGRKGSLIFERIK